MPTWRRRAGTAALATSLLASAVAVTVLLVRDRSEAPTPETAGSEVADLKPPMQGLVDRKGLASDQFRRVAPSFVVRVDWAQLQPAPGAPLADGNPIDQALEQARQAMRATPGIVVGVKIRVYAGIGSPEWAKRLDGEPFHVRATNGRTPTEGFAPRFWTDRFGDAFADLQRRLANRYDATPEVRDVTISRCTTVFAEPFQRQANDPDSVRNLLAAGFTTEQDERCHNEQIDQMAVWQRTHVSLAFNPYQRIQPDRSTVDDTAFTEKMMYRCRERLGQRCVLENNSLRRTLKPGSGKPARSPADRMYARIEQLGPPITFQTATLDKIADLEATVRVGIELGANSIELPAGYEDTSPETLRDLHERLIAAPTA